MQYTCGDYEESTSEMERSYSAKACPWDNACIESFHSPSEYEKQYLDKMEAKIIDKMKGGTAG